jgi:hypothetical protein
MKSLPMAADAHTGNIAADDIIALFMEIYKYDLCPEQPG